MNWVKKKKLSMIKAIQYNGHPCIKLEELWNALHNLFNLAQNQYIDPDLLDKISDKKVTRWSLFSKAEIIDTINKYNNSSTSGLDKLSWRHLKKIVKNEECINKLIDIANNCIDLGHWLSHFKTLTTVIISKPNKVFYNSTKSFYPIVLLNTTRKLFEKMIGKQLQFSTISNNFIHLCQLDRLKYRSTTDVGVALTHFIQSDWIKNLYTSTIVFDIA